MLFTVAQQLEQGVHVVTDTAERDVVVLIHWEAGKKAMTSGAFVAATKFFEQAISILGERIWTVETYAMCLALHNAAAEACYSSGDYTRMDHMLDAVLEHANTFDDKLHAYITQVFANGSRKRFREAVTTAFDVLGQLGEPLPSNSGKVQVLLEYVKLRRLLRGKSTRYFSNLPTTTDSKQVAIMTMLNFAMTFAHAFNPLSAALAMFTLIRLSCERGITGAGAFAVSGYGAMLVTLHGSSKEGFRYGQIAVDMVDRIESRAWFSRVYFLVYGAINPWARPFRDSLEPLRLAQWSALRTGDADGSFTCAFFQLMLEFHMGIPLASILHQATALYRLMTSQGRTSTLAFSLGLCHLASELCGEPTPGLLDSDFDVSSSAESIQIAASYSHWHTIVHCHRGEYGMAVDSAEQAQVTMKDSSFALDFYEGLSCLALARNAASAWSKRKLVAKGRRCLRRFNQLASSCPANFRNKRDLLNAELESIRGKPFKSFAAFEDAINMSIQEGLVQEEGLAYDRLARYHCYLGHPRTALPYFVCARDAYRRWGAFALVQQMEDIIQFTATNQIGPTGSSAHKQAFTTKGRSNR